MELKKYVVKLALFNEEGRQLRNATVNSRDIEVAENNGQRSALDKALDKMKEEVLQNKKVD